jgi:hypothetical protein
MLVIFDLFLNKDIQLFAHALEAAEGQKQTPVADVSRTTINININIAHWDTSASDVGVLTDLCERSPKV